MLCGFRGVWSVETSLSVAWLGLCGSSADPLRSKKKKKYLKLPDGTCVFVLMDGVFIFGTEEQSINEWEAKLRSKCQTFGVTIKQQERWQERGAAKLGDDTKDRESVGKSKFGNVS